MLFFTNKIRIGQISVRVRPDIFFKSRSGRNRIFFQIKIWPDPDIFSIEIRLEPEADLFSYQDPAGSGYQTKMAISGNIRPDSESGTSLDLSDLYILLAWF